MNKFSCRMAGKANVVDQSFHQLGVEYVPEKAPVPIDGKSLMRGCLQLQTLMKQGLNLPNPVRQILNKEKLSNRDAAVCLRRLAKWSGLAVNTKKLQERKADGTYTTRILYSVR